ncbi:MAG: lipid II flippase MurJ [Pedobacter sp.]|uniref:lipid II flippase MurJ n=1 Tax=Pedobacter sp. TaxID=1411316 RepID=UPI0035691ED3
MRRKAGILLILKGCRLGISVLSLYFSAKYFGVTIERDVWLLAINVFLIFDMAIWGPINETFRAKFIFIKEEQGEKEALQKTSSLLLFTNVVTVVFVIVILWKPELISTIIAPTYKGEQLILLLFMIRIMAPSFLFNQVNQLLISVLNSYRSIYIPEVAGLISGIINLMLIIILAPKIGILSLAYGYYLSLIFLLMLLIIQIRLKKIRLFSDIKTVKLSDTKPFILFSLPFFIPYFIGQVALIIEKTISTLLGSGVVSMLDYSRKFSDILTNILLSILVTMFVPVLSSHFMKNNIKGFVFELKQIYQFGFLLLIFVVTILTVCSYPFISIIYQSGNISDASLHQISKLTMYYSWSTIAIFFYYIFGIGLLSSKKEKYYALYGSVAQIIMILLNLFFYKRLNAYIFPFSLFISHFIAACLMLTKLPYGKKELVKIALKYISILLSVILLLYFINHYFILLSSAFMVLFINIFLLTAILLAALFLFRLEERIILINIYQKIFKKHK